MKGNAAFLPLVISLLCCTVPARAAQFQPNGLFLIQPQNQGPTQPFSIADEGDFLKFTDGSILHGGLKHMDTTAGLSWSNAAAKAPIDFRPGHVDSIRFAHADSVTTAPTAHLHFANGDDVFGTVASLDNNHLSFSTWFGPALTIPRSSVQSITFLSSNYSMLYDGPGDADGWIVGSHNPESWILRDGTFIGESAGTIGRDFKLTNSSTVEFDLAWSDDFEVLVDIYSDSGDHVDYNNSYLLEIRRTEMNLRHVESAGGGPPRSLGSAPLRLSPGTKKVRVTIQSNKQEGTVSVFVDNVLVKRWKDENGFSATGGGIFFQQQGLTGSVVKISHITVSQWEGRYEPETAAVATNADVIRFINHDQAAGKIQGIARGKITLALGDTLLQIPIQRVTQINFAAGEAATAPRGPWVVRAYFPRGGSISFQLDKWSDKEVSGRSEVFGSLAFQPGQIRQLEFNLGHAAVAAPVESNTEYEGLDE